MKAIQNIANKFYLKNRSVLRWIMAMMVVLQIGGCAKYLDIKPDQRMVVPQTLDDCQLILNNTLYMNIQGSALPEMLADNFTVASYSVWNTYTSDLMMKAAYIYDPNVPTNSGNWGQYKTVFYANAVLDILDKIAPKDSAEQLKWNKIKGAALFFRGFSFFQLAQLYAPAYDATTAKQDLGIPLRLTSDISVVSTRASVQETYDKIISDLTEAVGLLPTTSEHVTQPGKAAAYAMLSRTYLMMRNYPLALTNAANSLNLNNMLLDFNQTNAFVKFSNVEMLFYTVAQGSVFTQSATYSRVSPSLYNSYAANDKRASLYFRAFGGGHVISGSYSGVYYYISARPAVDEMYLNRAECNARAGNKDLALADLNTLLRKRYNSTFTDFTAATTTDALALILTERQKELVYRNIRWSDIRRLNKEGANIILTHGFPDNPATYSLQPNEKRYVLLIPQDVINKSGIQQNPR